MLVEWQDQHVSPLLASLGQNRNKGPSFDHLLTVAQKFQKKTEEVCNVVCMADRRAEAPGWKAFEQEQCG